MDPKWYPKFSQNDPKMVPKWSSNGFKTVPKWFQNGTQMVPKWSQKCPKWFQNGFKMVPKMAKMVPRRAKQRPEECFMGLLGEPSPPWPGLLGQLMRAGSVGGWRMEGCPGSGLRALTFRCIRSRIWGWNVKVP